MSMSQFKSFLCGCSEHLLTCDIWMMIYSYLVDAKYTCRGCSVLYDDNVDHSEENHLRFFYHHQFSTNLSFHETTEFHVFERIQNSSMENFGTLFRRVCIIDQLHKYGEKNGYDIYTMPISVISYSGNYVSSFSLFVSGMTDKQCNIIEEIFYGKKYYIVDDCDLKMKINTDRSISFEFKHPYYILNQVMLTSEEGDPCQYGYVCSKDCLAKAIIKMKEHSMMDLSKDFECMFSE